MVMNCRMQTHLQAHVAHENDWCILLTYTECIKVHTAPLIHNPSTFNLARFPLMQCLNLQAFLIIAIYHYKHLHCCTHTVMRAGQRCRFGILFHSSAPPPCDKVICYRQACVRGTLIGWVCYRWSLTTQPCRCHTRTRQLCLCRHTAKLKQFLLCMLCFRYKQITLLLFLFKSSFPKYEVSL